MEQVSQTYKSVVQETLKVQKSSLANNTDGGSLAIADISKLSGGSRCLKQCEPETICFSCVKTRRGHPTTNHHTPGKRYSGQILYKRTYCGRIANAQGTQLTGSWDANKFHHSLLWIHPDWQLCAATINRFWTYNPNGCEEKQFDKVTNTDCYRYLQQAIVIKDPLSHIRFCFKTPCYDSGAQGAGDNRTPINKINQTVWNRGRIYWTQGKLQTSDICSQWNQTNTTIGHPTPRC